MPGKEGATRLESEYLPKSVSISVRSREAVVALVSFLLLSSAFLAHGSPVEVAPEVRVVGRRAWVRPAESGEASSESVQVEASRATAIAQAVSRLPSVAVRRSGGEGSEPQFLIRGQDPRENRYFLEGVPLTDAEYQSSQLAAVPLESLSRIDVFPSGVPIALASDGLGGALHFRLSGAVSDQAKVRAGAYGLREAAIAAPFSEGARVTVRGILSDEDFLYFDDNGTPFNPNDDRYDRRRHNRFRRISVLPSVEGKNWSAFSLTSLAGTEVPGPLQLPASADLTQGFQVLGVKAASGDWTGHGWFRGDWQRLQDPQRTLSTNYSLDRSTSLSAGARSRWEGDGLGLRWSTTAGLGWDGFLVSGSDGYRSNRSRWQGNLGVTADWRRESLLVTPGVLASLSHFPAAGAPTRNFPQLSPRLGAVWSASPGFRVRANLGRHFRVPALAELHGSPSGLSPSADLKPETADKAEAGFDAQIGQMKVGYTLSAAWARDLVTYLSNSQFTRVAVNVGRSRILSQELAADVSLPLGFSAGGTLSWMATENQSSVSYWQGKELPYRPTWRADNRLGWKRGAFRLGYSLTLWGELYEDLINQKRRESLVEHALEAAVETKEYGDWRLEAANLTDVLTVDGSAGAFRTVENTTGYLGYPAPGRRLYLSWRYSL